MLALIFSPFLWTGVVWGGKLDSLEMWAHNTFKGHYVPRESLFVSYERALADDDMPLAVQLAAAVSFVQYGTIDSALVDIAYCFARQGDISAADEAVERAQKIYGFSAQVEYVKALVELYSGAPRRGIRILKKALRGERDPEAKQFLATAIAFMEVLRGDIEDGFTGFRKIEHLRPVGHGAPLYEVRLLGVKSEYRAAVGTLWVRQYYGGPSMLLRIRPVFEFVDGSVSEGKSIVVEQICSILGSPYFQVNVERSGVVHIPRWGGVPASAEVKMWLVYVDETGNMDSVLVKVSGKLVGFAPADSFTVAIEDLRSEAIKAWFDSLFKPVHRVGSEPFWQFVLSERVAYALSDSSQWERGVALLDSVIKFAPYLTQLYLWRGAFSLFMHDYEQAYQFFTKPLEKDSCNVYALYDAGIASFFLKKYELADSLFARATSCDSLFAPAYLARGVLAQDYFEDFDSAARFYEKYLSLSNFLEPEVEQWLDEVKQ